MSRIRNYSVRFLRWFVSNGITALYFNGAVGLKSLSLCLVSWPRDYISKKSPLELWLLTPTNKKPAYCIGVNRYANSRWPTMILKVVRVVNNSKVFATQTKLTDLPLTIADRRHSLLGHVAAYHQTCQPTISSSTVSTSRRADALSRLEASTWSAKEDLDTTGGRGSRVQSRCGHRRRIARCGGRYGPRWSSAAVSEWVSDSPRNGGSELHESRGGIVIKADISDYHFNAYVNENASLC